MMARRGGFDMIFWSFVRQGERLNAPMMNPSIRFILLLLLPLPLSASPERSGGDATVFVTNRSAFSAPASNLPVTDLRTFASGNRLFNTNWVIAPASVDKLDGLGPVFNRVSCSACHLRDGRGRPPEHEDGPMMSMLIRLSLPGKDSRGNVIPHPAYGDQLNDRAIPGVSAEGRAVVRYEEVEHAFADGSTYRLAKPIYTFKDLAFGPLGEGTLFSPRVAPQMIGLGLLEAVPEKTIEALADPNDADGDGIKGKTNRVWDETNRRKALGRFGWKANQPSLRQQNAAALLGDIGITTSIFPRENITAPQKAAAQAPTGGSPELGDDDLNTLTFYTRVLAVPARRNVNDPVVLKGEKLFTEIGCAKCHIPTLKTGDYEIAALAHQTIHPYTDLLLHDMGEDLADHRPDFEADGRQWRTPPLWGVGLFQTVNGHTRYLHDGRARNLLEAIMWHGGEAEPSREKVRRLEKEDRNALIKFLESL